MDPKSKRKPVPAGGQPTPAAIANADSVPPAGNAPDGASGGTPPTDAASGGTPPVDAASGGTPPVNGASGGTPPVDGASGGTPPAGNEGATNSDKPADAPVEVIEARVLVAYGDLQPDDIVSGSTDEIEQLKLAGRADPHPDAVAYARSLRA